MSRRGFIQVVRRVGTTPSMKALVECHMDEARVVFGAFAAGLYLLGDDEHPVEIHVAGLPDRFIDGYERYGREVDPLFEAMLENHEPVHERCLFQREDHWVKQPLFVRCSAEYDVGHYLLGPIVANGRLIGTMNFGRRLADRAFGEDDRMRLAVLSAHVSAAVAAMRTRGFDAEEMAQTTSLTRREIQIVSGVSRGETNSEIARSLWVTESAVKKALKRVFLKCRVTSRAALAAWFTEQRTVAVMEPQPR